MAVLKASNTIVGTNVRSVSIMPTVTAAMPVLFVAVPVEKKTSLGVGDTPKFTTAMSLIIVARVAASTINTDEFTASSDIDTLVEQVEQAILTSYDLLLIVQQFTEVETNVVMAGPGGTPIGEATMHFVCDLFQNYHADIGDPLTEIVTTVGGFPINATPDGLTQVSMKSTLPQET